MAATPPPVRFGVIGLAHLHVFGMTAMLRGAGAELVAFHGEGDVAKGYGQLHPEAKAAGAAGEILEDETIELIVCADVPDRRAAIGIEALRNGKDALIDKPAAVSLDELVQLDGARRETGRRCALFYSERLASPSTLRAEALVAAGAIGRVVEVSGVGPHQLGLAPRPDWFFEPACSGGILGDLASHQMDQFLAIADADDAEVVFAETANHAHPDRPAFEDYGRVVLRSAGGVAGSARVDWYTPAGLGTWGDVRLSVLGTEGFLEVRKNVDPAGRPGAEHLILVDGRETRHVDCHRDPLPFAARLLADVRERTETAQHPARAFRAQALALEAQARASAPISR